MDPLTVSAGTVISSSLGIARQVRDRIGSLSLDEKLRKELCMKVNQVEGILRKIETIAHDTSDELMIKVVRETQQDLDKCLTACKRIEQQRILIKLLNDSNEEVLELKILLAHSLRILNTCLTASNYSANADSHRYLRHLENVLRNPQAGFYQLDSKDLSVPETVREVIVKEKSPGVLRISWKGVAGGLVLSHRI